jgi:glycine cleavage system H protein
MSLVPDNLKFAPSHEWVRIEGNLATVGITDHAQEELTDIVFVELPESGKVVAPGDPVAVVESVKTASDIYSPVAGKIIEINSLLSEDPSLVNSSPYDKGWFLRIELDPAANTDHLLDPVAYQNQIGA